MKHKLIYGGIGLVIAGVAIAVPLGITLSGSNDSLTAEEQAEAAARAAEEAARKSADLAKQVAEKANQDLLKAQEEASHNALIGKLNQAEDAYRATTTPETVTFLDNYILAQNRFILSPLEQRSDEQVKVDAAFVLLSSTTEANALKSAFEAVFNDQQALPVYITLARAQNKALETQIAMANANAARNSADEAAASAQRQLNDYRLKELQLKYWNEHTEGQYTDDSTPYNFQGYTPGTWSLANGDTPVDKKFPIDFAIPSEITEIKMNTFTMHTANGQLFTAQLPEGLVFPASLNVIEPYAFAGIKNVPLGFANTKVNVITEGVFMGATLPTDFVIGNGSFHGWRIFNDAFKGATILNPNFMFRSSYSAAYVFNERLTDVQLTNSAYYLDGHNFNDINDTQDAALKSEAFLGATFPAGYTPDANTLKLLTKCGWVSPSVTP